MEQNKTAIMAKDYNLLDILSNKKYSVDYFQREYKWESRNIEQLVADLTGAFMDNYHEGDKPKDVANYRPYYMGSIVLSEKGSVSSIIDGQQRITSLTLLLIYLYHATEKKLESQLAPMIYSDSYGELSFNIDILERQECLKSLFEKGEYDVKENDDESTSNMAARYDDICKCFPIDDFKGDMLKSFVYWIMNKLIMVKITALSEENAYTIFETMNDRGVPLTPSDMLKGFILSKFTDNLKRKKVNAQWRKDMQTLGDFDKGAENLFFQSWLRSQYALTIRQSTANAVNQDFENIGVRYHNWFKDNFDKGLLSNAIQSSIEDFIEKDYRFYLKQFKKIKEAEWTFRKDLEHVYYHQFWNIAQSLYYPLYLAPIIVNDDEDTCNKKIDLVAHFLDNFAVRRSTNYRHFSASSIRYTMCNLVKTIRGKQLDELRDALINAAEDNVEDFDQSLPKFCWHGKNRPFIKYFLARITSYIEENSGKGNKFVDYMCHPNCKKYEVEHIWSDHFEWHQDEFSQSEEFSWYRNCIGNLILLPNGVNQSFGDIPVSDKLPHYIRENLLAQSLCPGAYINNPTFLAFIKNRGLQFKSYTDFKKNDIIERSKLYASIANLIWNKSLE